MSEASFFVTGLPRSGTAWLANALNYGSDAFCFHDCERDILGASPEDQRSIVLRRLYQMPHFVSGNVSSGMTSWKLEPEDGPLVIIDRPWEQVESSIRFAMVEWGMRDAEVDTDKIKQDYLQFIRGHRHAEVIKFRDLFTVEGLTLVWQHCLPQLMAPKERFEELVRHKITVKAFDYTTEPTT